jgi:hypothetical protein
MTGPDAATWAAAQAAKMPPLTDEQAAEAGRLAAALDAKPADQPDQQQAVAS